MRGMEPPPAAPVSPPAAPPPPLPFGVSCGNQLPGPSAVGSLPLSSTQGTALEHLSLLIERTVSRTIQAECSGLREQLRELREEQQTLLKEHRDMRGELTAAGALRRAASDRTPLNRSPSMRNERNRLEQKGAEQEHKAAVGRRLEALGQGVERSPQCSPSGTRTCRGRQQEGWEGAQGDAGVAEEPGDGAPPRAGSDEKQGSDEALNLGCVEVAPSARWSQSRGSATLMAAVVQQTIDVDVIFSSKWDEKNYKAFQQAFLQVDASGNGMLSWTELRRMWRMLLTCEDHDIDRLTDRIFGDIDQDGNQEISWDELISYLQGGSAERGEADMGGVVGWCGVLARPESWREWLYALVEPSVADLYQQKNLRVCSWLMSLLVQVTIVVSVIVISVESLPAMQLRSGGSGNTATQGVEIFCVIVFTTELAARIAACPCRRPESVDKRRLMTQRQLWLSFWTWVDAAAILPFYVISVTQVNSSASSFLVLRILRLLRLFRIIRVLKLGRHSQGVALMVLAIMRVRVALLWMVLMLLMGMTLFGSLMYSAEIFVDADFDFDRQKWMRNNDSALTDAGQPIMFQSIPDGLWWGMVTLCTVGYGDMYPVTVLGRVVAVCTMGVGLVIIAYPITMLNHSFSESWDEFSRAEQQRMRRVNLQKELRQASIGSAPRESTIGLLLHQRRTSSVTSSAPTDADPPPPPPQDPTPGLSCGPHAAAFPRKNTMQRLSSGGAGAAAPAEAGRRVIPIPPYAADSGRSVSSLSLGLPTDGDAGAPRGGSFSGRRSTFGRRGGGGGDAAGVPSPNPLIAAPPPSGGPSPANVGGGTAPRDYDAALTERVPVGSGIK